MSVRVWNGKRYYLKSYSITRVHDDEQPRITFCFGPSDYLNYLATSLSLDRELDVDGRKATLREIYLANPDPWGPPVSFLTHSFGINLAVITKDNYALVAQRSRHVCSRPSVWGVAVNEGLQQPTDANEAGNPDFYKAAVRGVYEERGVSIRESGSDWPLFLSFGLDWETYQYALLGRVRLNLTIKEVLEIREISCKDRWETQRFEFFPFTLKHLASFLQDHGPWVPAGLVCLIHSLMAEESLGIETIMKELAKVGARREILAQ